MSESTFKRKTGEKKQIWQNLNIFCLGVGSKGVHLAFLPTFIIFENIL
jgi:hypothetical protein